MEFNRTAWLQFKTGQTDAYRFANPVGVAKANPDVDSDTAKRTEYRQGLLSTARGSISIFDKNYDERLSLSEYYREQNYFHMQMTGQNVSKRMIEREFDALDYNGDGFIDDKERANELSYLDRTKTSNKENGVITNASELREGRMLAKKPQQLFDELDYNYDSYEMANLGEEGDIDEDLDLLPAKNNGYGNNNSLTEILPLLLLMGNNSFNTFGFNNSMGWGNNTFGFGYNNGMQNMMQQMLLMAMLSKMIGC